ncbi:MAG: glycosyltransferase [Chitinophagales bacterium]|nr:glycosyltransferase [Chitinophagales bacterium]MDW8428846.1 glycosyltransferase [Chitinophagales bacterium]
MKKILYLSYDGLTDPLGRSQIIPCLTGLAQRGYDITIISAEKPSSYAVYQDRVQNLLAQHAVRWVPLFYQNKPKGLASLATLYMLYKAARRVCVTSRPNIIHGRSYPATYVGMLLKKQFRMPLVFDMKGFWVDERVDGNIWDLRWPHYRWAYAWGKRQERAMLSQADAVVSVSQKAIPVLLSWRIPGLTEDKIFVVCSTADFNHFKPVYNAQTVHQRKHELNIPAQHKIVIYVGSLSTWYLPEQMLLFFKILLQHQPDWTFLFVTQEPPSLIMHHAARLNIEPSRLKIISASYDEVPCWFNIADLSLFFIKPSFSKIASAPTKLAESLSMGLPVICNDIGDVRQIVESWGVGYVFKELSESTFRSAVQQIDRLLSLDHDYIRQRAFNTMHVSAAVAHYHHIYQKL